MARVSVDLGQPCRNKTCNDVVDGVCTNTALPKCVNRVEEG